MKSSEILTGRGLPLEKSQRLADDDEDLDRDEYEDDEVSNQYHEFLSLKPWKTLKSKRSETKS
jgi:hypothetical protein